MGNSGATDGAGRGLRKRDVPVYLDYQATTPTDPRVVQAMLPYFSEKFGNPIRASTFSAGRRKTRWKRRAARSPA